METELRNAVCYLDTLWLCPRSVSFAEKNEATIFWTVAPVLRMGNPFPISW